MPSKAGFYLKLLAGIFGILAALIMLLKNELEWGWFFICVGAWFCQRAHRAHKILKTASILKSQTSSARVKTEQQKALPKPPRPAGYWLLFIIGILGMLIAVLLIMAHEVGWGLIIFFICLFVARWGYLGQKTSKKTVTSTIAKNIAAPLPSKTKKPVDILPQKIKTSSPKAADLPKKPVQARHSISPLPPRKIKTAWSADKKLAVFAIAVIILCLIGYGAGVKIFSPSDRGAKDYTKESSSSKTPPAASGYCGNDLKDSGENCTNCPSDVWCQSGYTCVNGNCEAVSLCGNGQEDNGEDCSNCPSDVVCASGEECLSGSCTVSAIDYDFTVFAVTPIDTGLLYFDRNHYPVFTQESWARAKIMNSGNTSLQDAKLTVDFGNWADEFMENLGDIDYSKTIDVDPLLNEAALVKQQTTKDARFTLEYYDGQNQKHSETKNKSIVLLPPQYVSTAVTAWTMLWHEQKYAPFLQFYDDRVEALAEDLSQGGFSNEAKARAIFDGLSSRGLEYLYDFEDKFSLTYYTDYEEVTELAEFDHVKFPYQTYSEQGGDCEDLAILMCSLLQSLDINSYLIFWDKPDSGHAFMSFEGDSANSVYLETTLIGKSDYDTAVQSGAETFAEARDGWWSSIIVKDAFNKAGVRQLPAWQE